jgi:NAD(P)-dependent dehydrogenase (short-subunit alcohol dehydrogenase family)
LLAGGAGAWFAARALLDAGRRFDLRGRVVLITGASRGLGLVLAREFAREGAHLALCARDDAELHRARADVQRHGAAVFARSADVTQPGELRTLILEVEQALGPVDVLVNNAGVIQVGPLETMTLEDYEQALDTHFWGPLYAIWEVLPGMRRRGRGRIVNISSIGGEVVMPHLAPYCASKFALVGLSRGLRYELAKAGIYVTTVCPGLTRTGSARQANFKGRHRAEHAWFSISDALPMISMSAQRAARKIVRACRYGRAELLLSVPTKLAVKAGALCPELTADVLSLIDRLLPQAGGIDTRQLKGFESQSDWSPSWLTTLSDQAARENNEIPPR